ncbi:MAG: choice-of-anchor Q domain-containing protein [Pseudomonadota bacterium]
MALSTPSPSGELHVDYTLVNYVSGAVNLGAHFIMGDPRFVDAENGDFRLRADSPAINVGDSSVIESYPFLKDKAGNMIDLDGNRRIVGGAIDLGAYEYQ